MDPLQALGHAAPHLIVWWCPDRKPWDQRRAHIAGRAYTLEDGQQIALGVANAHPGARVRVTTFGANAVRIWPLEVLWDTGQDTEELDAELLDGRAQPPGASELPRLRRRGGWR